MAFDVSGLSAWADERSGQSDWLLKPITGSAGSAYIRKIYGIQGQNVKLPTLESTVYAQSGYGCGFSSSGTTTIGQKTITTSPFTIQEQICLRDLHQYFTVNTIPGQSMVDTWGMADMWLNRVLAQAARKIGMAIWQGRSTYTNDTFLKLINGIIRTIDNASDEVVVTGGQLGTAITTSNVRTIFEEALSNNSTGLQAIPAVQDRAVAFCGRDTFSTLRMKLMQDNLYHVPVSNTTSPDAALSSWEMYYPGTMTKVIGIPELNSSNAVDTGSLPTVVKNRIIVADPQNLILGLNHTGGDTEFRVWYSQDNDVLRLSARGFIGVAVPFTDQVVTY